MIRFYGLLALGAFLVICVAVVIGSLFAQKNRRQRIQSAFEEECDDRHAECKPEVKTLIALYLTMAAKHGPDSEEAKAFRFGTDGKLMQRLHGDDGSISTFNEQADVIDEVCRRMVKRKRRAHGSDLSL